MFPTGNILFSMGVNKLVADSNEFSVFIGEVLSKHVSGDWGDLCEDDTKANDDALQSGGRLFSSYIIPDTIMSMAKKVWIITEADRSATTLLFPSEY